MTFFRSIKGAVNNLASRKLRTFLTMLGMIIGIASVIVIIAVGDSAQGLILNQIKNMGSNLVSILPGASDENGPPSSVFGIVVTTLKYDDVEAIAKTTPNLLAIAGYVKGTVNVSWQNQSLDTNLTGTMASYPVVEDAEVEKGRFFSTDEEEGVVRVVVLGSQVAEELFEQNDPVGEMIKIKRENFRVIGVMKERGSASFQNQDTQIFVPLETAQKLLLGIDHLGSARAKIDRTENINQAVDQMKITLRERHDITDPTQDDFSIRNTQQALDVFTGVTNALKFFLAAIAAIALIVGGIGIMNIMLVSVNERIREIGLRKAVGATKSSILSQFLIETIVISFLGGVIGITLGFSIAGLVAIVANFLGYDWDFIVSLQAILLSSSISILVGLVFGIYPAYKAAKLDPIEALRYE